MSKLKVEFHCHTIYSKDSLVHPQVLVESARRLGINRLIVTDHNSIIGAKEAQRIAPDLVIVGEEILTTRGELLAAFVEEGVPSGLEPLEVIRRLKSQGAFISVSHPFDEFRSGHWKLPDLLEIIPFVDAIEVFNARCMDMSPNIEARAFAKLHDLAGTVGSDSHVAFELGKATLVLDHFSNADELRQVIRSGKESVKLSSPFVHLLSRSAKQLKKWKLAQSFPEM